MFFDDTCIQTVANKDFNLVFDCICAKDRLSLVQREGVINYLLENYGEVDFFKYFDREIEKEDPNSSFETIAEHKRLLYNFLRPFFLTYKGTLSRTVRDLKELFPDVQIGEEVAPDNLYLQKWIETKKESQDKQWQYAARPPLFYSFADSTACYPCNGGGSPWRY